MSLPHALLTALVGRSASGSDLAQRFDRSLGYFWHATHQQIYRELARMEALGWIASLPAESGRGRKRAYQILPAGQDELSRWVGTNMDPQPLRNELETIARELNAENIEQVVYAWILRLPSQPLPIIGSGKIERVRSAVVAEKLNMSRQQWFRIRKAALGYDVP